MGKLRDVRTVEVPGSLLHETYRLLREAGTDGREAIVLWAGEFFEDSGFRVTTILRPAQTTYRGPDGLLAAVSGDELFRINRMLSDKGLRLIAQVHTHPSAAYHSSTDDDFAMVTARGSLSIVVPDFAAGQPAIDSCVVYRLTDPCAWEELTTRDVAALILISGEG